MFLSEASYQHIFIMDFSKCSKVQFRAEPNKSKTLNIHSLHVKQCKLSVLNLENPGSTREIRIISTNLQHLFQVKCMAFKQVSGREYFVKKKIVFA